MSTSLAVLILLPMTLSADQTANLRVPEGFTVELAAGPPLVKHPIMAGLGPMGELYVAETTGENLDDKQLDARRPAKITTLRDTDGDGRFDDAVTFVDGLTFPQGALWHQGALYVCSPPGLWKFVDTDGDGRADQRTQLVTGFAYTGNAADVHGPFLHPSGRLYWCHGRKGHDVRQSDGTPISKALGARLWSCWPDGSDVQVHCGGGMDNPVELVFLPNGDILGSVNLMYGRPRGDCLVHWLKGGVYPRTDIGTVLAEFPKTGPLLGPVINFGHVAVSGLCLTESAAWGREYQQNIYLTIFNTGSLLRIELTPQGSTYAGTSSDFLTCAGPDFHPTDVLEDTDGSLLLIDTGGWFRIGCPTSQLAKPDVAGGIYRIRKQTSEPRPPRTARLQPTPSPAPTRAAATFADVIRYSNILANGSASERVKAVWALGRLDTREAYALVYQTLRDPDETVWQAACQVCASEGDRSAMPFMLAKLRQGSDPHSRRIAAEALGRLGDTQPVPKGKPEAIPATHRGLFLALADAGVDPSLRHQIVHALLDLKATEAAKETLAATGAAAAQEAALLILLQLEPESLAASDLLAHVTTSDPMLQEMIVGRLLVEPRLRAPLLDTLLTWLRASPEPSRQAALERLLVPSLQMDLTTTAVTRQTSVASPLISLLEEKTVPLEQRRAILQATADVSAAALPESWLHIIIPLAGRDQPVELRQATLAALAAHDSSAVQEPLLAAAADPSLPATARLQALRAARVSQLDDALFALIGEHLSDSTPGETRRWAATVLGQIVVEEARGLRLVELLPSVPVFELPTVLQAIMATKSATVGEAVLQALPKCDAAASLPPKLLEQLAAGYPAPVRDALLAFARASTAVDHAALLASWEAKLPLGGDPARGRAVFMSQKANCAACHRIAGEGGQIGPDLSTIGKIRERRDLLEAIVLPSASLARDYESVMVATTDGEVLTGVVLEQAADYLVLADGKAQKHRLAREAIDTLRTSSVSIMPAGLEKVVSPEELRDLLAYLGSLR